MSTRRPNVGFCPRFTLLLHLNSPLQLRPAHPHHPSCRRLASATQRMPQKGPCPWTFPHRHQALRCLLPHLRTRVLLGGPSSVVSQGGRERRPPHHHPHEPNPMAPLTIALFLFHSLGGRAAIDGQLPSRKLQYPQVTKRKNPETTIIVTVLPL